MAHAQTLSELDAPPTPKCPFFKFFLLFFLTVLTQSHLCLNPYPVRWLFYFSFPIWHKFRVIWEKGTTIKKKKASIWLSGRQVGGAFIFLINMKGPSPIWAVALWAGGPVLYKSTNWDQVRKQCSSLITASFPVSRFLPCLSSLFGFPQWWTMIRTCSQINPFFPKLFLIMVFIAVIEIRFLGDAMDQKVSAHLAQWSMVKEALLRTAASSHSLCADVTESME